MSKTADPSLVHSTLRNLGKALRLSQTRLRYAINQRKALQATEAAARKELRQVKLRIQREIDAHPDVIRDMGFEGED